MSGSEQSVAQKPPIEILAAFCAIHLECATLEFETRYFEPSHGGKLWSFLGAFPSTRRIHDILDAAIIDALGNVPRSRENLMMILAQRHPGYAPDQRLISSRLNSLRSRGIVRCYGKVEWRLEIRLRNCDHVPHRDYRNSRS